MFKMRHIMSLFNYVPSVRPHHLNAIFIVAFIMSYRLLQINAHSSKNSRVWKIKRNFVFFLVSRLIIMSLNVYWKTPIAKATFIWIIVHFIVKKIQEQLDGVCRISVRNLLGQLGGHWKLTINVKSATVQMTSSIFL